MPATLLIATLVAAALPDARLAQLLRAKDQALLDAIAPGDRRTWNRALAPNAIYIDENGTVMSRATFLRSLDPLPNGVSGHISIADYELHRSGNVALVVHRDDEREIYHGIELRAKYIMSETWLVRGNEWRLAMVHAYVVTVDPPAIPLTPAMLEAYVGTYTAGTDLAFVIERRGDGLVAGRPGGAMKPLLPEAPDLLFTPGQPRIKRVFHRNAVGQVIGFSDQREGEEIKWRKSGIAE